MKGLLCFFGPDVGLTETFKQRYDYYEHHYGHFGGFEQYISGITTDWLPTKREPTWIPAWIQTTPVGVKSLSMCPSEGSFTMAIPALLSSREYTNYNRVFLLEKVSETGAKESWRILGKTMSFDTGDFTTLAQSERLYKDQIIRG
jgi:hypothetical protein